MSSRNSTVPPRLVHRRGCPVAHNVTPFLTGCHESAKEPAATGSGAFSFTPLHSDPVDAVQLLHLHRTGDAQFLQVDAPQEPGEGFIVDVTAVAHIDQLPAEELGNRYA